VALTYIKKNKHPQNKPHEATFIYCTNKLFLFYINTGNEGNIFYLDDILDRERQRLLVIHESDGEQRPNVILIDELKGLGLDHHLAVTAAKLAEDAECDMGDLIAGIAEGAPQRLHQLSPHL
jgi:hypothetical protein